MRALSDTGRSKRLQGVSTRFVRTVVLDEPASRCARRIIRFWMTFHDSCIPS